VATAPNPSGIFAKIWQQRCKKTLDRFENPVIMYLRTKGKNPPYRYVVTGFSAFKGLMSTQTRQGWNHSL